MPHITPQKTLTFLAWLDCLERMDTLILEIRHLQINIIYSLKKPCLYQPLRFEQRYLWGAHEEDSILTKASESQDPPESWLPLLGLDCDGPDVLERYTRAWIISYPRQGTTQPDPLGDDEFDARREEIGRYVNLDARREVTKEMAHSLPEVWTTNLWSQDQRRYYNTLAALQSVKADILLDKLTICWSGVRAFGLVKPIHGATITPLLQSREKAQAALALFMLQRAAAFARIREYANQLGDLQGQMEKALDLTLNDYPRPMLGRRREQGLYTSFLASRSRNMLCESNHLMDTLEVKAPKQRCPPVLHRWHYDYTSRTRLLEGTNESRPSPEAPEAREARDPQRKRPTVIINSSFDMPERPELQSILAHEVAHSAVAERLGDLRPRHLTGSDSFSRLMRTLHHAMTSTGVNRHGPENDSSNLPEYSLKEVASDFIATTLEGHAYLYAMFLESAGHGVEILFQVEGGRIDLCATQHISDIAATLSPRMDWYFRLRLAATWLEAIHHYDSPTHLDRQLVDGVNEVAEAMLSALYSTTEARRKQLFWKTLTDRLCKIVKDSDAALETKKWRSNRSRDYQGPPAQAVSGAGSPPPTKGPRLYPRFTKRLTTEVRDFLFRMMIGYKIQPDNPMEGLKDAANAGNLSVLKCFDSIYLKPHNDTNLREHCPDRKPKHLTPYEILHPSTIIEDRRLFQHIYDIPWQAALIRSTDFLMDNRPGTSGPVPAHRWLRAMHCNAALGRELYHIAMEFYIWETRPPRTRLTFALRLVGELINKLRKPDNVSDRREDLAKALVAWCNGEDRATPLPSTDGESDRDRYKELKAAFETEFRKYPNPKDLSAEEGNRLRKFLRDQAKERSARFLIDSRMGRTADHDNNLFLRERAIERLEGYKLKELAKLLHDHRKDEIVAPLYKLFAIHGPGEDEDSKANGPWSSFGPPPAPWLRLASCIGESSRRDAAPTAPELYGVAETMTKAGEWHQFAR